ncbi:MAG: IclR family transcriptional regulator [Thermoleophilia bacterium]|nr:IclR family transcriptional regulator [Thermoleophilia bacterium]
MAATTASRETDPFSVRALTRGLSILCLFDVDHREWTIDEMVERTGLVRMTAYRMVRTLESMAFLVRDSATNRYRLGPAMLALCYVAGDQSEFVAAARPFLESLVHETGESVTLAVEVDGFPVCVDIINTTRPFKRQTAPGRILGDIATVHGKIFAAFKSPEEREELLARPRTRRTPQTVTDRDVILAELDRVVQEDVAYDLEGYYLGLCAVGAPVRDQFGAVMASISVVAPTGRFGPAESAAFAKAVKTAAGSFSAYLGWTPRGPT